MLTKLIILQQKGSKYTQHIQLLEDGAIDWMPRINFTFFEVNSGGLVVISIPARRVNPQPQAATPLKHYQ